MRKASINDIAIVTKFLYLMYTEITALASTDILRYKEEAIKLLESSHIILYEDKGFFIMKDISSPLIDRQVWDGVSVYILPEFRKTKILSKMYKYMFENFKGTIIGMVEPNSHHEKVVSKRYKCYGKLYEISNT